MRHPWRLLLLRSGYARSSIHISTHFSHFQVKSHPNLQILRSFTSSFLTHAPHVLSHPFELFTNSSRIGTCSFSSEVSLEPKDIDHVAVTDLFTKPNSDEEIRTHLESNNVVISHDWVLKILRNLDHSPDVASRVFDWVLKNEGERLSSKSYNLMLGILGINGFMKEFWDLVKTMKTKGYGVSKDVYVRVLEKFEKDGLVSDVENLRGLYASKTTVENICSRICKIIRLEVWSDDVECRLRSMENVTFSSDLVKMVLEHLATEPSKALIFFRWIEESSLFKHDEQTYNALARVLGREDCIDRFWKLVDEMRSLGYEMEAVTYVKILERFIKRKMIKEAVDLYEFVMGGAHNPSVQDCTFLLRKIVVGKDLDMDLFLRVVKVFVEAGNVLTNSTFDAVLKSLLSVGRLGDCNKILKAMEEGGLVAGSAMQSKIAFGLSSTGRKDEATDFVDTVEASGCNLDDKTWVSLIEGHCVAGDIERAFHCFQKMLERGKTLRAACAFELLVNAYCHKKRALDACKLLCEQVSEKQLKPWHTTYKVLINNLLVQGCFKDALSLLGLMKSHGFPPYVDPFIEYVSKSGTADDAIIFLKAMTVQRFPSTSVFLRVFEAFFKARRHNEAQDFLSKCPGYIRNHADVLNLFCSSKTGQVAPATNAAA